MIWSYVLMTLLLITSILLMIIILLQRGRGGGLAGAFGGLGGQSAFGTKAGDVFTKITIGLAIFWIFLAGVSSLALERDSQRRFKEDLPPQGVAESANDSATEKTAPDATGDDGKTKSNEPAGGTAAEKKIDGEKKTPEKPAESKAQPPANAKDAAPAPEKKDDGKTGEKTEKK